MSLIMSQRQQFSLNDVDGDRVVSFLLSFLIHLSVLFLGGMMLVHPIQYAVDAGISSMEVELSEAPPEIVQEIPKTEMILPPEKIEEIIPVPVVEPVKEIKPHIIEPLKEAGTSSKTEKAEYIPPSSGALPMIQPNYLKNPAPQYPSASKRLGQEGLVVLKVEIDRAGIARSVDIQKSSGFPLLDESAKKAVRRWKFLPAKIGQLSVETRVEIPIKFKLENREY